MNINTLFPIPIAYNQVSELLADKVENLIVNRLNKLERAETQYTDFFLEDKIVDINRELPDLFSEILQLRDFFETETSFLSSRKDFQYWIQDYRSDKDSHTIHAHGMYGISGVYWIRANENAGMLKFENPNPYMYYQDNAGTGNPFAFHDAQFPTQRGVILMFPSYLKHEVLKGNEGIIRTTLAFNFGKAE